MYAPPANRKCVSKDNTFKSALIFLTKDNLYYICDHQKTTAAKYRYNICCIKTTKDPGRLIEVWSTQGGNWE